MHCRPQSGHDTAQWHTRLALYFAKYVRDLKVAWNEIQRSHWYVLVYFIPRNISWSDGSAGKLQRRGDFSLRKNWALTYRNKICRTLDSDLSKCIHFVCSRNNAWHVFCDHTKVEHEQSDNDKSLLFVPLFRTSNDCRDHPIYTVSDHTQQSNGFVLVRIN
jgi:hypothetical protein